MGTDAGPLWTFVLVGRAAVGIAMGVAGLGVMTWLALWPLVATRWAVGAGKLVLGAATDRPLLFDCGTEVLTVTAGRATGAAAVGDFNCAPVRGAD
jgi:hypothetical protein